MDKVQEKVYAPRRLINEAQAKATREARIRKNPERFKRILPPGGRSRGARG